MASGKVRMFRGKWLRRETVRVICHAYNQTKKEIKAGSMSGFTVVRMAKCHVIITWEVLQAFLYIAMIFAVSIPNVWQTINMVVTQGLQP